MQTVITRPAPCTPTMGTNLLFAQPNFFFLEIPQGPLGISIGNIRSAQKAFRVPQSSVFLSFSMVY